jgi:Holliday junction resolvase
MGGKMSRSKGARVEREMVNRLRAAGIYAERVPLSGAAGGSFSGDVVIPIDPDTMRAIGIGQELRAEVKSRSNGEGFTQLEKWKGTNDILFLKRDRTEPMVVMDYALFVSLIGARPDDVPEEAAIEASYTGDF